MKHQGQTYGETDNCSVDQLTVMAWVTVGWGKGPVFHALQGVVTILCLGADVILSLTPSSGFGEEICGLSLPDASSDTEMTLIDPSLDTLIDEGEGESIRKVSKRSPKTKSDSVVITLVHGDAFVLTGDDFEARIKRTGTTILLIGTSVRSV